MRILVVDDDSPSRLVLATLVERLGHEVVAMPDGRAGWAEFERKPFQVVLSDWMMPDLDGLELCRRIRAADRTRYTYLILVTALGGKARYLEGMEAGADDFLTKPVDADELGVRLGVAERIVGLQAHVRQLEGLLPICSYCKRIRDEQNAWNRLELYISSRTDATFTHGICPDCRRTVVDPQIERLSRRLP
jgi:sigma-B regulation protein RsbU (phosphoserine phosphatase)